MHAVFSTNELLKTSVCSVAQLCPALVTVACQAPLSMGFPRQEYWNGLPFPTPRDLPGPGIKPASLALAGRFFTTIATWEVHVSGCFLKIIWLVP